MAPDNDFEPIVTERLVLRRSHAGDAPAIAAYRSDPEVHRYQGWERTDHDGVREEIEAMASRVPGEPGGWVQFSVEERDTGRLVGDVGLSPAEDEPSVIKVGYTMDPAFHEHAVEVNRLENNADNLLRDSLAAMFEESNDPIEVIKWKEIYETMEIVTDRCEDVANVIEGIILKMA